MHKTILEEYYRLPVERVMKKTGYAVLSEDASIDEVLEVLIDYGHIWITEHPGSSKVLGIIARKDFVDMFLPPQLSRKSTPGRADSKILYYDGVLTKASDMMTRNIIRVETGTEVLEVLRLMSSHFVRQLPITRHEELVGEVSVRDLILNYLELYKYKRESKGSEEGPCRDSS